VRRIYLSSRCFRRAENLFNAVQFGAPEIAQVIKSLVHAIEAGVNPLEALVHQVHHSVQLRVDVEDTVSRTPLNRIGAPRAMYNCWSVMPGSAH